MRYPHPLLRSFSWAWPLAVLGAMAPWSGAVAQAQTFPSKPVTLVVPFAAGGPADVMARLLGQQLNLGQALVVEAKPGAGGTIGAAAVAKAPADGHTLLFVTAGHAGTGALYPRLPYDPVKDFTPVIGLAAAPVVIAVRADSPYKTLQELVAAARANPGKLSCAGGGGGATVTNLAFELIKADLKLDITAIPYKGSAPAITGLLGGEIDCDSDAIAALMPHVKAGKLRALAVTTQRRSPLLPEVPTVAESVLPGMAGAAWYGVLAPKGTPAPVVERLQKAFASALREPQVQERLKEQGAEPLEMDAKSFGAYLASEAQRWGGLIRKLGLKAD
ncbi:Bug family tripartite tricarboxylate transporter substrate binding protein [Ideonella livida]|uniref:Tripartite tricarboxylate transporter substrate binding protein n=1 Tax=Ideonella livida TaxID=2707176 RepID=A0A7C9PJZ0_9BURK|nr:tripartite tricarboxylate transporter substrate-binding protein [Ideonella livida]NDY93808.1 tripartite tricarboxylate transporter substrate binding protein [Ideonella livida]